MQRSSDPCQSASACLAGQASCPERAAICGHCVFYERFELDAEGRMLGRCRLGLVAGFFACNQEACDEFQARRRPQVAAGAAAPQVAPAPLRAAADEPTEINPAWPREMGLLLRRELERPWARGRRRLHPRFEGGRLRRQGPAAVSDHWPIELLFERLCQLKGALLSLEEALDDQAGLTSPEREALFKQIRGIEGSLTTFNVLFPSRDSGFLGTGQRNDPPGGPR